MGTFQVHSQRIFCLLLLWLSLSCSSAASGPARKSGQVKRTRFFFFLSDLVATTSPSSLLSASLRSIRAGLVSEAPLAASPHTQVLELARFACLPLLAFGSRPRPLVQLWLFTRHAAGVLDLGLVKQGLRPVLLGGVREIHQSHTACLLHLMLNAMASVHATQRSAQFKKNVHSKSKRPNYDNYIIINHND